MSLPGREYPPAVYQGDAGEVSAWLRSANEPPNIGRPGGSACSYLATGESTNGGYGLYRWDMDARPSGPGAHFHRTMSESFFVLSGTVRLFNGATWIDAGAGDFLHVPPGGVHGFRNESGEPASMLILFVPGAPREEYFETLADTAKREAMTEDDWREFFARHDNHFV